MPDLVAYLAFAAPQDITASQMRNLAAIRQAYGQPISAARYNGLLAAMRAVESRPARARSRTPLI